jgi:hypothetical protein
MKQSTKSLDLGIATVVTGLWSIVVMMICLPAAAFFLFISVVCAFSLADERKVVARRQARAVEKRKDAYRRMVRAW